MAYGNLGYSPQQQQMFQPYQQGKNGPEAFKPRSAAGKYFLGEQEQFNRTPTQTPQGMSYLDQLLQSAGRGAQNPQAGFAPIAQEEIRRVNEEFIPGLSERFTSLGGFGSGGLSSPAFTQQLRGTESDLASRLAAMSSEYGLKNRAQSLQEGQVGLTPQFETQFRPGGQGAIQQVLQLLAPALQSAAGGFGKQLGQFAGNKAFGQQGGQQGGNSDISSLIMKLLPLLV